MDILLSNLTRHAMNYAIRSGVTITTGYAINQCSRLLKTVEGEREHDELEALQLRLESKIRIVSPAINMIELIAARGNTSLDSAVALTRSIRLNIQSLGARLSAAADLSSGNKTRHAQAQELATVRAIIAEVKQLLAQIEDAVPLINLAITTSGVNMSTALPTTVSPSRLLQASTFLSAGDSTYNMNPGAPAQIGPVFVMSLYMLFRGHATPTDARKARSMTWKEVIHKARVKIMRVRLDDLERLPATEHGKSEPLSSDATDQWIPSSSLKAEYAYQLLIVEDLDDGRVHEDEAEIGPFNDVPLAGIREAVPIHQVSKIFYADTGKILNLGGDSDSNSPILLLKRDPQAVAPRKMMTRNSANPHEPDDSDVYGDVDEDESAAQIMRESSQPILSTMDDHSNHEKTWQLPPDLDPQWLAFEVYAEEPGSSDEDEDEERADQIQSHESCDSVENVAEDMSKMKINTPSRTDEGDTHAAPGQSSVTTLPPAQFPMFKQSGPASIPALRTSLSLLELLIRLTALQQFQQTTHLAIEDELLNFFLSESSSTGAGADSERRKMMRAAARRQVGFDPYAESPIRIRGENTVHAHGDQGGEHVDSPARQSYATP